MQLRCQLDKPLKNDFDVSYANHKAALAGNDLASAGPIPLYSDWTPSSIQRNTNGQSMT